MAKKRKNDMTCPECNGTGVTEYQNIHGIWEESCDFCGGTGIFSDEDMEEKFVGRYDYNG